MTKRCAARCRFSLFRESKKRISSADPKRGLAAWYYYCWQPPAEINQLMSRLHTTLSRSTNPALLELRILANHGSDPRFASFLKREGRWYDWWVDLREGKGKGKAGAGARRAAKEGPTTATALGALGGLAAYGSDSDDDNASSSPTGDDDGDGQEAQDRFQVEAKDDAGQGASSSSTASVPESASTVPSTTTTITSSITSAPPPPPPAGLGAPRNGDSVELTVVPQGVKAAEEDREGGQGAKRREEEEKEKAKKKEARAAKAREWARRRREARREEKEEDNHQVVE